MIGFDTRFMSDRYARDVARVLAANGFKAFLAQADCPTPAISFAVQKMRANAGIMITASHNPPRYNGIKLKSSDGASAPREQCRRVEVYLNDNENRGRGPNQMDFDRARDAGLIERFNPITEYYEHLRGLIDFDAIVDKFFAAKDIAEAKKYSVEADKYTIEQFWALRLGMLNLYNFWQPSLKGYNGEVIAAPTTALSQWWWSHFWMDR